MIKESTSDRSRLPTLAAFTLAIFVFIIWLAGGASRADVLGQSVVRAGAWATLTVAILAGFRPAFAAHRTPLILLAAAVLLTLAHLVPLPPELWQSLPGRGMFAEAAAAAGQPQPWRPLAIVPEAGWNAAASLVVPATMLVLALSLSDRERLWLPAVLLVLVAASALVALLQFSGAGFNNIFVNGQPGDVSGTFANRNHFALFLSFGCAAAPAWAFLGGRRPRWRAPVALVTVLLLLLTIMASGSRTGLLLGVVGTFAGFATVHEGIRRELRWFPRWAFPVAIASFVAIAALLVLVSVGANRAVAIDRFLKIDVERDLRGRVLPTILAMVRTYFPWGTGVGAFDPVFRIHEPFELLSFAYLNHAHNDFLEVALDAGLPGIALLITALMWWAGATFRAWRAGPETRNALPKLGSSMLLLIFIASIFDYPARTPLIMATIILAALWLDGRTGRTLPSHSQPL